MAVSRTEGGLGLMSCVRESSPSDAVDADPSARETKKRRFHPLRGLRRMFRRKGRRRAPQTVSADELSDPQPGQDHEDHQDHQADRRRSGGALHSGLSLSHDSVFSPGPETTDADADPATALSVQRLVSPIVQAELVDAVRRRRQRDDTSDEEDLGLPHSPANNSPTHDTHLKETVSKSNHSTCSDGSLLSVGSSEMDEDSYGQSSGHGSKLSLHEKKGETTDVEVTSAPLSHSAARHKMAIKPKRTHGVPRKRKSTQLAEVTMLPATPEVNEESNSNSVGNGRSVTPELPPATGSVSTAQLKSASLPPGTSPVWPHNPPATRLARSRSSATAAEAADQDTTAATTEPAATATADQSGSTFFGRLLSRRSGKKKKNPQDKEPPLEIPQKRMDEKGRYMHEVMKLGRHHPAARQRVEPINLSQDRSVSRTQVFYPPSPPPPDSPRMRHREVIDVSDDENTLEGRTSLKKIIPLEVDSSIPKRTFVKKSQSFRRDEALPFVSLDTPSLPVGLGVDLQKDAVEDLNELTTMEVMDQHVLSDKVQSYISEAATTTTVTINTKEEPDSCKVTVTADSPREIVESPVKKSISLDSIHSRELNHSSKKSASSENIIHHQVTIPINPSIVNISPATSEPPPVVSPSHNVKPEPRKNLKEGNKELPNFYPVPAPRPSKRDSMEAKPPRVPEFLRVQLNHVDSKPAVNVVLSTVPNTNLDGKSSEQCDQVTEIETTKEETAKASQLPSSKISKTDDIGDSKLDICKEEETTEMNKQEVCVPKELVDPNQVKFINSVKQWSASPYTVSANPNYSIVSIAPRAPEAKKCPEKPVILTNQSVHKTVIIKEVKEKSSPLVEKNQDVPPLKPVLRQRSFVGEEKPANLLNNDKFSKADDVKVISRKKSLPKDVLISDIDRSRKLSLEKLDSRNQENISELKRKSREMSSSEDNIVDRNSYGSSDTLASQESGEVVLRRKSLSREIMKQKEEEPELLKVFARRSLKVKDCDAPDDLDSPPTKSRDSDKENECGDSPPEERKRIKEHLVETKQTEKIVPSVVAFKYQRSVSANNDDTVSTSVLANSKKDNNSYEKRQRSRTIPDPKITDPPSSVVSHKDRLACIFVEKEVEVISLEKPEDDNNKEENVPSFKRIQQRKEEWEKRAQLAMKNNLP